MSTSENNSFDSWLPDMLKHLQLVEFHAAFPSMKKYSCRGAYILSVDLVPSLNICDSYRAKPTTFLLPSMPVQASVVSTYVV